MSCLSLQIMPDLFGQKMSSSHHMKEHGVIVTRLHKKIGVVMIELKDIMHCMTEAPFCGV